MKRKIGNKCPGAIRILAESEYRELIECWNKFMYSTYSPMDCANCKYQKECQEMWEKEVVNGGGILLALCSQFYAIKMGWGMDWK